MTELDKSILAGEPEGAEAQLKRFSPEEMVSCEACGRGNPPTRGQCLYCGAALPAGTVAETNQPAELQQPQAGQQSPAVANTVYVVINGSGSDLPDATLEPIASRLELKLTDLRNALEAGGPLPLRQVETIEQAATVINELKANAIPAVAIESKDLAVPQPKKIRALEFSDRGVTGSTRTSNEQMFAAWDDLILIVVGRLQSHQVELIERRKRGGKKPVDRRELSGDESVLDLYSKSGQGGWRITAGNFDFGCLGEKKGITTFENFKALIGELRERAANLEVDTGYLRKRVVLGKVWPLGEGTQTGGWRRSGAGKYDLSTLTSTDNEAQFNNYSRLVHLLKTRVHGREDAQSVPPA